MNTAACLVPESVVSPPEAVFSPETAEPAREDSPPPLPDISLRVPSDRDFEIYEQAVFAGLPQRLVAKKQGISQPRVHQILREMAAWMADNTPAFAADLSPEQQLRLAHYNLTQQLEHHRQQLMQAWRRSRGVQSVSRTTVVGNIRQTVEYTRPTQGNPRYLNEASRAGMALLKLSGWTPAAKIPAAPQNSPFWQVQDEEESGVRDQQSEEEETGDGKQETEEQKSGLSSFAERAKNPNLTRAEIDAITAEQEAVYAALLAKVQHREAAQTQSQNTLSLGTGPLLPEGGKSVDLRQTASHRLRKPDKKLNPRHDFLRGEPPVRSIQDFIEQKK